jgi:ATP-binding cassette subfamily C protein
MGQKQRIALARSLISDREVLVLDEALASIDISNAKLIIERLLQNPKPKLIIQISHRLNELEESNMILNISKDKRLVIFSGDNESSSFDKYIKYIRNK